MSRSFCRPVWLAGHSVGLFSECLTLFAGGGGGGRGASMYSCLCRQITASAKCHPAVHETEFQQKNKNKKQLPM